MNTALDQPDLLLAPAVTETTVQTEQCARIDALSYEEMLRLVRTAPLDHPLFRGEVGKHFHAVLRVKRQATPEEARARISARIGI